MDEQLITKTIKVSALYGEQATSTGKRYWQLGDEMGRKYRIWDSELYDEFTTNGKYTVEISPFRTQYKGKPITINSIRAIKDETVPLDTEEPLDAVIAENERIMQKSANEDKPDWDAIARGKVRNSVASAAIQNAGLISLTDEVIEVMEEYVNYIINGPKDEN